MGKGMSICKSCGAQVTWLKEGKRWFCRNADGADHWDLCSARKWLQTKSTGKRFENLKVDKNTFASGYADSIHGTKFDHVEKRVIIGERYKPSGCDCGVPPWELCNTNCEHALDRLIDYR